MRQLFKLIILCALLMVAACEPGLVTLPTNTPGVTDPTPTQETPAPTDIPPVWDTSCLPPGVFPINPNPCPTYTLAPMVFFSRPNGNWESYNTGYNCETGQCVIDLTGAFGFAGNAGVVLHNLVLLDGHTYAINFNGNLDLRDGDAPDNYAAQLRVYRDDGSIVQLRDHGVVMFVPGAGYTYSGDRDFFWCIAPHEDMTVAVEASIRLVWAKAHAGNNFAIEAVYVYPVDNINVCGEITGI